MLLRSWSFYLSETWANISKNRHASVITALQILVSFFLLGFFLIIIINANLWVMSFLNNLQVVAFLDEDLDQDKTNVLYHQISDSMSGITQIEYISKEDAMELMKERTDVPVEDLTERNPLPPSFKITISSPRFAAPLAEELLKMDGVSDVVYGQQFMNKYLLPLLYFGLGVCFFAALVIAGATVMTITNTIRLAIYARRKEIRIMQLVGATDWAIRGPFLLEGLAYGFVGSLLALLIHSGAYTVMAGILNHVWVFGSFIVSPAQMTYNLAMLLLVLGTLLGAAGSLFSVDRYLEAAYLPGEIGTEP